jgi:hypothetical protein
VVASEPAQPPVDSPSSNRHVYDLAGMATGGGLIALGVVLWASASGVQGDITNAPTTTRADLVHLKDLESRGDAYAAFGNIAVVTGLVVGGVATYFYIRDRRTGSTATARLTPTVLGHGAGLVLTIGGTP